MRRIIATLMAVVLPDVSSGVKSGVPAMHVFAVAVK
jgi:hypothetical protein